MYAVAFFAGSWPPSPGLLPWAILISSWSARARYWAVTPKRADATCLIRASWRSPVAVGVYQAGSSPPSPVFAAPPARWMPIVSAWWASGESAPDRHRRHDEPADDVAGGLDVGEVDGGRRRGAADSQPVADDRRGTGQRATDSARARRRSSARRPTPGRRTRRRSAARTGGPRRRRGSGRSRGRAGGSTAGRRRSRGRRRPVAARARRGRRARSSRATPARPGSSGCGRRRRARSTRTGARRCTRRSC